MYQRIKPGKKTKAWNNERKRLKEDFKAMGIGYCEAALDPAKCWKTIGLGFAHVAKRRNLKKGELGKVILCCPTCHHTLDHEMDEDQMRETIEEIIDNRQNRVDYFIENV